MREMLISTCAGKSPGGGERPGFPDRTLADLIVLPWFLVEVEPVRDFCIVATLDDQGWSLFPYLKRDSVPGLV